MNHDPENPYRPFRDSTWDEPDRPRRDVSLEEAERMPMTDEELDLIVTRFRLTGQELPGWVVIDTDALVAEVRQVRQERANLKQMLSQCEGDANRMQFLIDSFHHSLINRAETRATYEGSPLHEQALEMLGLDEE